VTRATPSLARRAALALGLAALLAPAAAEAQIFKVSRRSEEPQFAASLGVGFFQTQVVNDGTTSSQWRIDDGAQYRGSLEYALKGGSSIGVVGTHARLPLRYLSSSCPIGGGTAQAPCGDFSGEVTVQSLWGTFHGGGSGTGLHGVLDAGLGYTWYRDFAADDGDELDEVKDDKDFSFHLGSGFGYGFTRRLSINLVQDFIIVRHQGENLASDVSKTTQQRATRVMVRYGFGSRRPGV